MGQKTHPIGFRLGIVKDWNSSWFTSKNYADWLNEDLLLRKYIATRVGNAGVAAVKIKRFREKVIVIIQTSRPGVVIGRKGSRADTLRAELEQMIGKSVKLDIEEVKKPELSAPLVAEHVAAQLTGRVSYRRAMKKSIATAMRMGAKGSRSAVPAVSVVPRWPVSKLSRRQRAPAHPACRCGLRDRHGPYHLRRHRREGLDLSR